MDENMMKILKAGGLALGIIIGSYLVGVIIYFGSFKVINTVDTRVYDRFATNNLFDNTYYISEDDTGFSITVEMLETELGIDTSLDYDKRAVIDIIFENLEWFTDKLSSDDNYLENLESQGLSLSDFQEYIIRYHNIDEYVLKGSFYIAMFLVVYLFSINLNNRKLLMYGLAFAYIGSTASTLSDGLYGNLIYYSIEKYLVADVDYNTYLDTAKYFVPAFKEGMLTYVIFDTVSNISKEKKLRKEAKMLFTLKSIEIVLNQLNVIQDYNRIAGMECIRVSSINVDFTWIIDIVKTHNIYMKNDNVVSVLEKYKNGYDSQLDNTSLKSDLEIMYSVVEKLVSKQYDNF